MLPKPRRKCWAMKLPLSIFWVATNSHVGAHGDSSRRIRLRGPFKAGKITKQELQQQQQQQQQPKNSQFQIAGNDGNFDIYPLKECMGDCDKDDDCQGEDMFCFFRKEDEKVPGCKGGEREDGVDYCVSVTEAKHTKAPTFSSESVPIQVIQDPDANVNGSTVNNHSKPSNGTASDDDLLDDDSIMISLETTPSSNLSYVGLSLCQGICKSDDDCGEGLICYTRNLGGDVPHCTFDNVAVKRSPVLLDFCTLPPTTISTEQHTPSPAPKPETSPPSMRPTLMPVTISTPSPTSMPLHQPLLATFVGNGSPTEGHLLERCQGDCDDDRDCEGNLICYQRSKDDPVPGCYFDDRQGMDIDDTADLCIDGRNTGAPTFSPTKQPTPAPTPWPTPSIHDRPPTILAALVQNRDDEIQHLKRCEGDCDSDSHCEGDLVCYSRYTNGGAPGCLFEANDDGGTGTYDVCIDKKSLGNEVRIRLHWEKGYRWQESSQEAYWCWDSWGKSLDIYECNDLDRQKFVMMFQPGGEALIRAVSRDECIAHTDKVAPIFTSCDPDDPAQRWIPMNGSWDNTFEITRYGKEAECLTPEHHPRSGEAIEILDCAHERKHTTTLWTLY